MKSESLADCPYTNEIRGLALTYPEVEENGVCGRMSFKARGKGFVSIGLKEKSYDVLCSIRPYKDLAAGTTSPGQRMKVLPRSCLGRAG